MTKSEFIIFYTQIFGISSAGTTGWGIADVGNLTFITSAEFYK